jgi:hypothetical protein
VIAPDEPEVDETAGQVQAELRIARRALTPLERRPQIVVLGFEPIEP